MLCIHIVYCPKRHLYLNEGTDWLGSSVSQRVATGPCWQRWKVHGETKRGLTMLAAVAKLTVATAKDPANLSLDSHFIVKRLKAYI